MSQITGNQSQCPTPSIRVTFDTSEYQYGARLARENDITNGLVASLYGALVVLSIQSIYVLMQHRTTRAARIVLSLAVLALLASTTTYMAMTFISTEASYLNGLVLSRDYLWTYDPELTFLGSESVWDLLKNYIWLYQRISTATVMINIIIGDAIVWWRACVIWNRNRIVQAVCGVFLLVTFLLGVLDATLGSSVSLLAHQGTVRVLSSQPGVLFEDISFGLATCALSLATNLAATLLIAYKAWKCRRRLKGYLAAKVGGSQVAKVFAILVESGAFYCAIWVIIVAYQISNYNYNHSMGSPPNMEAGFLDAFGVIMHGAVVPLIAIYPTIVIVLVASSTKSHMEQGLTVDVWTSRPNVIVGITTIHHAGESRSRQRSDAMLDDMTQQDSEDEGKACANTTREWKPARAYHTSNV